MFRGVSWGFVVGGLRRVFGHKKTATWGGLSSLLVLVVAWQVSVFMSRKHPTGMPQARPKHPASIPVGCINGYFFASGGEYDQWTTVPITRLFSSISIVG